MDFRTTSKKEFFGLMLHALDYFRLSHLNITGIGSLASHKATEEFYEETSSVLDKLIETTQASEGLIDIEIPKTQLSRSALEYAETLFVFIETNKKMFEYSFQQNLIDEIQTNLMHLIYKLKYLK